MARVEFLIRIGLHECINIFSFNFYFCWTFLIYPCVMFSFLLSAYQFLDVIFCSSNCCCCSVYRNGIQFMVDNYNSSSINTQAMPIRHKYAYAHSLTPPYESRYFREGQLTRILAIPVDFTTFKYFGKFSLHLRSPFDSPAAKP